MRFLVLGAAGMAGHMVSLYLKEAGHDVTGLARRELDGVPCVLCDARNTEELQRLILSGKYDTVVNCIGILNRAAEQRKADAAFLNAYLPHFLAEVTEGLETRVIHMSTDCVFSGRTGGYTEDAPRDGETFYDRSKALGELEDGKNLTLRNSIVGPDINPGGIGLLNWFMQQEGPVNGYTGAMWTGMTTLQLAKVIEKAAEQGASGLYNMVPVENISKYELLKLFNRYLRGGRVEIRPFDGVTADKTLIRTRFAFAETVPGYDAMVWEMADWMRAHARLYPHYRLLEGA